MLVACASTSTKVSDFELSQLRYEKAWRWNDVAVIANYHQSGTYDTNILSSYSKIRIGDYKILNTERLASGQIAQNVVLTYFFHDDIRVKTVTVKHLWEYNEEANRWVIVSPLPVLD